MIVGIMQPYFFPYIGYFQLIKSVDTFVVYDNIKYTKKGWINRNRILQNGKDAMFSLSLKSGSDSLDVRERELAADFNREKLLNQIKGAYRRAPYFEPTIALVEGIVRCEDTNLFGYIFNSIAAICKHLGIDSEMRVSSTVDIDHGLKSQEKVLAICKALGADTYINAIGGMELYSRDMFSSEGIELRFIRSRNIEYAQLGGEFVPWLSIIDVLMFNDVEKISTDLLGGYDLIENSSA
jgi:hypothetical protein